jgi:hypothetical protein
MLPARAPQKIAESVILNIRALSMTVSSEKTGTQPDYRALAGDENLDR